jgi:isopentenyl diphosphate isomerase/L-lactate dehydrogenase-like FMN-dependent dehydrogenase
MGVFEYRLSSRNDRINVEDYRRLARRRLPKMVWSFIEGGADDEVTLRDNVASFSRWALKPRVLAGAVKADTGTTVAGVPISSPVLLGPTGFSGLTHWRGDLAVARAAENLGTRSILSTSSSWSIEEVAAGTREDHFFQLYPRGSDLTRSLLQRAEDAGFRAMFVTVDVPVLGNRESEQRMGMGVPPVLTPKRALNVARHPRWLSNVLIHQRVSGRNLVGQKGMRAAMKAIDAQNEMMTQASLDWDDVAWIRDRWKGPLFLKGVLSAEDAARAVRLGFDGVVVSNHGGRQLDCAPASLAMLPEVVAAVGGRAEVLLDGGVRRGTDVAKALALGARAVLISRPYLYGLAVGGQGGVEGVLDILDAELRRTLTLIGAQTVNELDRSWLTERLGCGGGSL